MEPLKINTPFGSIKVIKADELMSFIQAGVVVPDFSGHIEVPQRDATTGDLYSHGQRKRFALHAFEDGGAFCALWIREFISNDLVMAKSIEEGVENCARILCERGLSPNLAVEYDHEQWALFDSGTLTLYYEDRLEHKRRGALVCTTGLMPCFAVENEFLKELRAL